MSLSLLDAARRLTQSRIRSLAPAIAAFVGLAGIAGAQNPSVGHDIDMRWNKTFPAGPYSALSTAYGGLETDIPLLHLRCAGGMNLDLTLHHRSNQIGGVQLPVTGNPGIGWTTSLDSLIQGVGGDMVQFLGGNGIGHWSINYVNGQTVYNRRPGCRADLTQILDQYGTTIGYKVSNQDKSNYYYYQVGGVFRLGAIQDGHGNLIQLYYDGWARLISVYDPSNQRYITFVYGNGTGTTASVSNITLHWPATSAAPAGTRSWSLGADSLGHLTSITMPSPDGGASPYIQLVYDGSNMGNITDLYDLKRNHWQYYYGLFNYRWVVGGIFHPKLSAPTTVDPAGIQVFYSQDQGASQWTTTCYIDVPYSGPVGGQYQYRETKHIYLYGDGINTSGNPWLSNPILHVVNPVVMEKQTNGSSIPWYYFDSFTWNFTDGTLASYSDRRGNTTTFTYSQDNHGLMFTKTDPRGFTTTFGWANDLLVSKTDPPTPLPNGTMHSNQEVFTYDAGGGLLTDTKDPSGIALTTHHSYDAHGNLTSTWMGADTPATFSAYDAFGNSWSEADAAGNVTTSTFDGLGNKLSETLPNNSSAQRGATHFTYDGWNRPKTVTHSDNSTTSIAYDANGNKTSITDELSHTTSFAYDALNRETSHTRLMGGVVPDITESCAYDMIGNKISATNGANHTTQYAYDERNFLNKVTYPDTKTQVFHYDGNGNRDIRIDGNGKKAAFTYDVVNELTIATYADNSQVKNFYRADGLRNQMNDGTSVNGTLWKYNAACQLVSCFQPLSGKTVNYTYDASGRRKTLQVDAMTWTCNYDSDNRLSTVTQTVGVGTPVTYAYNPDSSINTRTNSGGLSTVFTYDDRGRNTAIAHRSGTSVQEGLGYTYDLVGNVTYTNHTIYGTGGTTWNTSYGYDNDDRLTSEIRTSGSPANFNIQYAYDGAGNRTQVTRNGSGSSYSVDSNDKILSGDGYSFSGYDSNGNPGSVASSTGTKTFTYDLENRVTKMTSTTSGSVTNTFRYDGDGRRVERVDKTGTTRYVYDGSTIVEQVNASNAPLEYDLSGVGFVQPSGSAYLQFYFRDNALGSNIATVDSTGTIRSRTEYDAFGNQYNILSGIASYFRFAGGHGYVTDPDSGMDMLGARYYMPGLGRFLTQDPKGHAAGLNLYAYCDNNPLIRTDPSGLDWDDFKKWWHENVTETACGWFHAVHATVGFITGTGPTKNVYREGSLLQKQLKQSDIGHWVEMDIIEANYMYEGPKTIRGSSGHWKPFISTIAQPTNATQAQVGGCVWDCTRDGNVVHVHVHNEITLQSLCYQWFGLGNFKGWDRAGNGFGPLGTVTQDFYWDVTVPQYWRR